jgi:hypothetical protein
MRHGAVSSLLSGMLKNPLSRRLLEKVQMQGGARCRGAHRRWVGGVLRVRRSECASLPTPHQLPPRQRAEMLGLFQQPVRGGRRMRVCRGAREVNWKSGVASAVAGGSPGGGPGSGILGPIQPPPGSRVEAWWGPRMGNFLVQRSLNGQAFWRKWGTADVFPRILWRLSAQEHSGRNPSGAADGLARLLLRFLRQDARPVGPRSKRASGENGHDVAVSG